MRIMNERIEFIRSLTRALVGSFYNAIWWGGGLFLAPPRISGTTGPIYKTQAAFDSPGQFIERK